MSAFEYPNLDAAIEQSTASLIEQAASDCGMLAILKGDDDRWYCRVGGEGDPVIIADTYEAILDMLVEYGVLDAVHDQCRSTRYGACDE